MPGCRSAGNCCQAPWLTARSGPARLRSRAPLSAASSRTSSAHSQRSSHRCAVAPLACAQLHVERDVALSALADAEASSSHSLSSLKAAAAAREAALSHAIDETRGLLQQQGTHAERAMREREEAHAQASSRAKTEMAAVRAAQEEERQRINSQLKEAEAVRL